MEKVRSTYIKDEEDILDPSTNQWIKADIKKVHID
jgi:hypothetical protein